MSPADFGLAHLAEPPLLPGSRPKNLGLGRESGLPLWPVWPVGRAGRRAPLDTIQRLAARPTGSKPPAGRPPPRTLTHFLPHPSLLSRRRRRRVEGDGAGEAARGGGGGGAVGLCSPEVHAAAAGVQLRRAPLIGALIPTSCAH